MWCVLIAAPEPQATTTGHSRGSSRGSPRDRRRRFLPQHQMPAGHHARAVSISVSFAFVRGRPPATTRLLRRTSRTAPTGRGHTTRGLKIGRPTVRPRPWPPHTAGRAVTTARPSRSIPWYPHLQRGFIGIHEVSRLVPPAIRSVVSHLPMISNGRAVSSKAILRPSSPA